MEIDLPKDAIVENDMEAIKAAPKPIRCGHCGNVTRMLILSFAEVDKYVTQDGDERITIVQIWRLMKFSTCNKVNVFEIDVDSHFVEAFRRGELDEDNDDFDAFGPSTRIYPPKDRVFQHAPHQVIEAYDEAKKVLKVSPASFAVMVGRTLEFLCEDRKARGSTLALKIDDLASRGEIPPELAEMARSLKSFRNIGAHASNTQLSEDDALAVRGLCETIIEYVYETSTMLKQVRERIDRLNNRKTLND